MVSSARCRCTAFPRCRQPRTRHPRSGQGTPMKRSQAELDALLSRGRMVGPAAERVLENVLGTGPRPTPWWRRVRLILPLAAVAVSGLLLTVWPRTYEG